MNTDSRNSARQNNPSESQGRSRDRRSVWLRWSLIGLGVVLFLAVTLEASLRAAGFVYHYEKPLPNDYSDDTFVFMCVGDSSTKGWGAKDPEKQSYPAQLKRILDERHSESAWEFVNLGAPGMNTSQAARRFEGWCRSYHPDMAILMVGNNDIWNLNDTCIQIVGQGEAATLKEQLRARVRIWADSLRVVGLWRELVLKIKGDDRTHDWNPMAHQNPSYRQFSDGLEILGPVEQVKQVYLFNYRRIIRIAEKYGVELLWMDYHVGARFGETAYVGPALDELSAEYVDLFALFHEGDQPIGLLKDEVDTARRDLLTDDLWHPTALGYAAIARAVYNKLVDLEKVPGPKFNVLQDLHVH